MEYEVIYSKRKSVSISVKGSVITVKAPKHFPKRKIKELIEKHEKWILTHLEYETKKQKLASSLTEDKIKELRNSAKKYFKEKIECFSTIMGIKYGRITITGATTRFGSCSSAGNISFSYRLMLYPEEAREYVVVHELAHILEMNHSSAFYAIIEKYLPDYKYRKKLLKEIPL